MNEQDVERQFNHLLRRIAVGVSIAMLHQEMSVDDLAKASGLSARTIRRVLTAECVGLTLRDVVMLELGLKLEFRLEVSSLKEPPFNHGDDGGER